MYILFAGECYYARGGANDFINTFSTLESAVQTGEHLASIYGDRLYDSIEWWHVFCTETMQSLATDVPIARSDVQAHGNDY